MKKISWLAFSVAFSCCGSIWADAPEIAQKADSSELADLREIVARMQSRIDELEAAQGVDWITAERADQIRSLVADVLADADQRSSLLDGGPAAGWDKDFYLGSPDGNFMLRVSGQIQVRLVLNDQDMSPVDDNRAGLELRRTKLTFYGHIVDPSWQYEIELDASRSTGSFAVGENGWIRKDLGNGFKVRAGQFKPMYLREEAVSSKRLLTVERSQVNSMFSMGIAQGVELSYSADWFRLYGAIIDDAGSGNTAWSAEDTEFAFAARGEVMLMGSFDDVNGDVAFRGSNSALMIGGGVSYLMDEFGTGMNLPPPDFNNLEIENLGFTADVTWMMSGANITAAFFYRHLESDTGTAADINADQVAFVIRGGYFVTDSIQLFAAYEWGDLDMAGVPELSTVTFGVTKFWDKHNLKWTNDIGFGLDPVASMWATDGAGWRADAAGRDGQIVIRSQFQLLF